MPDRIISFYKNCPRMNTKSLKTLSIIMVAVLVLNIIYVLAIRRNFIAFWIIIAICAIFAYLVLPKLRKQ